jgi:NADH-quinone oxidoreductase subunit M
MALAPPPCSWWPQAPRIGAGTLFFSVASLGLPGLGNFIGEFLVLLGSYRVSVAITAFAALGLVAAPVYALHVVQKVFFGVPSVKNPADFGLREMGLMIAMMAATLWLGLYPQPMLNLSASTIKGMAQIAGEPRP